MPNSPAPRRRPGDFRSSFERIALRAPAKRRTGRYPRGPVRPEGLRSFDRNDAGFFLDLPPGARDRDGTPECLRFRKARVEAPGGADSFKVGLI